MNENQPELMPVNSETTPIVGKSMPEKYQDMDTVISVGIDDFNEKKEKEEQEAQLLQDARTILDNPHGRNLDSTKEKFGIQIPIPEKRDHVTGLKRLGVALAATFASLLPAKEAKAQQNMHSDKEGIKKEAVLETPKEFHDLTNAEMDVWKDYRAYVLEKVGEAGVQKMVSRAEAEKILQQYRHDHPGTILNDDLVERVQEFFQDYKEWVLSNIESGKAINGRKSEFADGVTKEEFMKNLSKKDRIGGPQTLLRDLPTDYIKYIEEVRLKSELKNGKNVDYIVSHNEHVKNNGYMHIDPNK